MDNCESSQSVRVAVNVRPLVTPELLVGCTDCITVYPAEKQVPISTTLLLFFVPIYLAVCRFLFGLNFDSTRLEDIDI